MILFVVFAGLILLGALSLIIPPLFRPRPRLSAERDDLNIRFARERLAELKAERAAGRLSDSDFDQTKAHIEEALLADLDSPQAAPPETQSRPYIAIVVAALLPITAVMLYLKLGTPAGVVSVLQVAPSAESTTDSPTTETLLMELKDRLAQNPADSRAWSILAHIMMSLGNYPEAVTAYEKLYELTGEKPDVMARYADALAMAAGGDFSGRPTELIKKALELDPDQPQGLWLAGMAAEARGEIGLALEHWYRLEPLLRNEPEHAKELSSLIERVTGLATEQGLDLPQRPATRQVSQPDTGSVSLTVVVEAASELAGEVRGTDTLYVYARSVNGPAAPVAAVRLQANTFPMKVTLDDRSAVMSNQTLSSFQTVVVGAHISRTGSARRQSGDLTAEAVTTPVNSGEPITLRITARVP